MLRRMDATNMTDQELANVFIDYVNATPVSTLAESYKDDIYNDENSNLSIGNFRLIHVVNSDKNEYLTYSVCFQDNINADKDEIDTKILSVHNIEKDAVVLICTFKPSLKSWSSDHHIKGVAVSAITNMVMKLKSIL